MKKINKSLVCSNCYSSNVQYSIEFRNEQIKYNEDSNTKTITRQKFYNCKCNDCGHNYIVDHGSEKYILFEKSCPINCLGDINLLVTYDTESGFEHSYKICSITSSPYDENIDSKEISYLMFIEGEEFPVLISKETVVEIIEEPNKARSLVINNIQGRHR